ncbi:MAG TPA: hypothetical protein VFI09_07745 [Solirubrobacterales bacterium]|nr:hypothetical protein [Solirubrobacterales bacterium]
MRPGRLLIALLALVATLAAAGCGSSGGDSSRSNEARSTATATTPTAPPGASARSCEGTAPGTGRVRVTGVGCDVGRGVVAAWAGKTACVRPAGESRFSCSVYRGYRCLGAAAERGIAVSCSRPGSSVSFLARRG